MSRTKSIIAALAAIGFGAGASSAIAGDTARNEDRVEYDASKAKVMREAAAKPARAAKPSVRDGFELVPGEAGWQLVQHKYELRSGRFEHSDECDHVIRSASAAPQPGDVERIRQFYPGG